MRVQCHLGDAGSLTRVLDDCTSMCLYVLGVLYTKLAAEDTGPQEADILEQETKQTVKPEFHSI